MLDALDALQSAVNERAGVAVTDTRNAGTAAGGGGSGGYASAAPNRAGGDGAAGQVVLTWTDPPPPVPPFTLVNYGYIKVGDGMGASERIK